MNQKLNVLYLHSHDTGRMVQPYGFPVDTPALSGLASESVMFRSMFAAAPTCSPSRAALLTGEYPHTCGQLGTAHRGFPMSDYSRLLARVLRSHGYSTALAGIQHEAPDVVPLSELGYEKRIDGGDAPEAAAANWLRARASASAPFFLSCGFFETHREYPLLNETELAGAREGIEAPVPPGFPDIAAVREDFAGFRKSVSILDSRIGVVLATLSDAGLSETTIVLCTTDHGIAFPGMKCTLKDGGLGVMCFLKVPGMEPTRVNALTSHLDVVPTLYELLGIEPPDWLAGHSLVPLLDGRADSVRDAIFAEINFHAAPEPTRAIRTERYKYIRRYAGTNLPVLANVDDGPTKTSYLEADWDTVPIEPEQLYDVLLDPTESCNRISDERLGSIREHLSRRLDSWMESTGDPLLNGGLTVPTGAQLNSLEDRSPRDPTHVSG